MDDSRLIVGIGEALFDVFPQAQRLGGAPLNVAVHARQLGNRAALVTRIGQDALGAAIDQTLAERGVITDHIQHDPDHPTGTVMVDFDTDGEPTYEIVREVAWDYLQWDGDLDHLAGQCHGVCFGTLAQRDSQARNVIYRFVQGARRAVKLLDLNLRKPFYDRRLIERSMEMADAVKLSRTELDEVSRLLGFEGGEAERARLAMRRFKLSWVAVTAGAEGTAVYTPESEHRGAAAATTAAGSAVGAGDAVAAALLHGVLRRWPWEKTVALANQVGAFVASHEGAVPELNEALRQAAEG